MMRKKLAGCLTYSGGLPKTVVRSAAVRAAVLLSPMKHDRLPRSPSPAIVGAFRLLTAAGIIRERLYKVMIELGVLRQQVTQRIPSATAKERHLARAHREATWRHWRCLHPMHPPRRRSRAHGTGPADEVEEIGLAVRKRFGCACRYGGWARVRESSGGDLLWEGFVQIFYLRGSSEAERCYAWIWKEQGHPEIIIVPNSYFVTSAEAAVHHTIGLD